MSDAPARGPRVAYDAGPLLDAPTGVGRYARELADSLEVLGVDLVRYAYAWGGNPPPGVTRKRVPARLAQWAWRRSGRWPIESVVGRTDVVHGTNFVLPAGEAPGVVTVHDLSFMRDDTFPGGERLRTLVPWSVDRAARVITPTDAVRQEVVAELSVEPERVSVTHEGVSPLFFGATPLADTVLEGLGVRRPFVLAAGTIEPRKNLRRLLQAWSAVADDLSEWTLVLGGPRGWGPDLPKTKNVILTGWLGDETLPGLLAAAELFCYPSVYEGFGLPPLEAMATGTPVIAGSYPCASEVLGDAAVIVDSSDVDALAGALSDLAGDGARRRSLVSLGRARAAQFTWLGTARATLAAYREVVR